MKDRVREDLRKLCYHILENKDPASLSEQLTRVQMLYERLLVINYLEENAPSEQEAAADSSHEGPRREMEASPEAPAAPRAPDEPDAPQEESGEMPPPHLAKAQERQSSTPPEETPPSQAEQTEKRPSSPPQEETPPATDAPEQPAEPAPSKSPSSGEKQTVSSKAEASRKPSLNQRLGKGTISVGLNDRLAFVKHLFKGQQEDFNRVLSQLNTMENYQETIDFLQNMVKPEYDWEGKEEYEERLYWLIRKRFGEGD